MIYSIADGWKKLQMKDCSGRVPPFRLTVQEEEGVIRTKALYLGKEPAYLSCAETAPISHGLNSDTPIYAEGYTKLSQTVGTIGEPMPVNEKYTDQGFYHFPARTGYFTAYNLLLVQGHPAQLLSYSSARRFTGVIHFNWEHILLEQRLGNILVEPGEELLLEDLFIRENREGQALLQELGDLLAKIHQPQILERPPTGWCSWYCFGPKVTQQQIVENMGVMQRDLPGMQYVQIDDGYQRYMGDYLDIADSFENFDGLIQEIHRMGLEPAIWVAPFIAEKNSALLRDHADYFVQGEDGNPVASDQYSYGGWRNGPWYMLDASNPSACDYLENVFRVMRERWSIRYFKLDANVWGAMPFGKRHNPKMSNVEAYRQGMEAVARGAGPDSYLLGCNAPMWPSIGLVQGMRVTNDIAHKWDRFKMNAQECFYRNWQHRRLWVNDPDCLLLSPQGRNSPGVSFTACPPDKDMFSFHRNMILASAGAVISGDDLTGLTQPEKRMLRQSLNMPLSAAVFQEDFSVGRQPLENGSLITLFNSGDAEKQITVALEEASDVWEFWENSLITQNTKQIHQTLRPHSGMALYCTGTKHA